MIDLALISTQAPWVVEALHDLYYIHIRQESPNKRRGKFIRVSASVAVWLLWIAATNVVDKVGYIPSGLTVAFLCFCFHFGFFGYAINLGMWRTLSTLNRGSFDIFLAGVGPWGVRLFIKFIIVTLAVLIIKLSLINYYLILLL